MLLELRVENYAVIDHVAVEFGPGLNLLTGETGAGKSILIDALALVLGEKASADSVRHGAQKAIVTCVFQLDGPAANRARLTLEKNGIDADMDELIIRREIAATGKGRVFINNQPATVAVLRQIAPDVASVHAQQETILGFDSAERLELLDSFAGLDTTAIAAAFGRWTTLTQKMGELQRDEQDRLRMLDLWSFQHKEIAGANLHPGEDAKLETEKRVLANSERLYASAMAAYDTLYDSATSAAASLRTAQRHLEDLARFDPQFIEHAAALEGSRVTVDDVSATLRRYADGINASPERLAEVEDRLAVLDRLKRKYGQTVEEVIGYGDDLRRKLKEMENLDELLKALAKELAAVEKEYLDVAGALSQQRTEAARKLQKLVEGEINELAMKATFRISVTAAEDQSRWTAGGVNEAIYLISPNPGEPLKPIEQSASGGELSRVMLALKTAIESSKAGKKKSQQRTLVFDEIDIGIGGRAAEAVGKKLKELARGNQVLCITHLPQVASFADQHYVIQKRTNTGRTKTSVRRLEGAERTEEIARMLSGAELTDTSRKHAATMLKANTLNAN